MTLRSRDLQAVLSFVADAQDADGPEALNPELLDRLAGIVGCEYATYETFDWQRRKVTAYVPCSYEGPDAVPAPYVPESFWTQRQQLHATGLHKLSDLVDRRGRERIRDEEEYNAEFRVVDALGLAFGGGRPRCAWLAFHSQGRDFGERDRELALTLGPHVDGLRRRSIARKQLAELTDAVERDESAVVVVDAGGRISHATTAARHLLLDWFGTRNGRLPVELDDWHAGRSPGERYATRRNGTVLTVEATGDFTLTLSERSADTLRLTPREREVLGLVAEGLTNVEIAQALWVAPSTVSKHLEQAYAKLGVHTRTAAVARLAQLPG